MPCSEYIDILWFIIIVNYLYEVRDEPNASLFVSLYILVMFIVLASSKQQISNAPKKAEYIDDKVLHADAPLLNDMGNHHHSVTINSLAAQRYVNQDLIMSFVFNYAEAVCSLVRHNRLFKTAQCVSRMKRCL